MPKSKTSNCDGAESRVAVGEKLHFVSYVDQRRSSSEARLAPLD
ncbi:hypothetical protein [Sporisorium scitamineum]|uniref:Uncharacterized protein n=1 Tax=Sporisorium scitamineum TaxID=49012 RepID=A0A0F7RYX8_9BASI|nr:hypothetical protein [Sporisorium scitamineum]